jgi:hypothetical protein
MCVSVCNEPSRSRAVLAQQLQQQSHRAVEFVKQLAQVWWLRVSLGLTRESEQYWEDEKHLEASLRPLETANHEAIHRDAPVRVSAELIRSLAQLLAVYRARGMCIPGTV